MDRSGRNARLKSVEGFLLIAASGALASLLGSLVGIGGGLILVPALTLGLGVPIHHAVAASLVSVIANSSMASIGYTRDEITNIRLGMTLEVATTLGAVCGGLAAAWLDRQALMLLFAAVLGASAVQLLLKGRRAEDALRREEPGRFGGRFHDAALAGEVSYAVRRLPGGLALSALAGATSGLLGIGGGPIKVPMMTVMMGIPMKAAAATSNFMIGVTACASAALYYGRGMMSPAVAVPAALGSLAGAWAGARLSPRVRDAHLTLLLSVILTLLALKMGLEAWRSA